MAKYDSSGIEVKVTKYGDRANLIMYFDNPATGRRESRSTGTSNKKEALIQAAHWEAELKQGKYKPATRITWSEFRERYENEVLPSLASKTDAMFGTVFNHVEQHCRPKRLADLSPERISRLQFGLREAKCSEHTIRSYLAHLKSALAWGLKQGMLREVPEVEMPKRAKCQKVMKGRPITGEEFERMIDKVEAALLDNGGKPRNTVGQRQIGEEAKRAARERMAETIALAAPEWKRLLKGLWLSGLRLGEALNLTWDDETKHRVELGGRRPKLIIRAEHEKGNQNRELPLAPDFAQFLAETPESQRRGHVFRLIGTKGRECRDIDYVKRIVSKIGQKSGVKVNTDAKGKVKFASAHDLRRSFGSRWAMKVMPAVLKELMRHEDISTTMKYYVGISADSIGDVLWEATNKSQAEKSKEST